MGSTALRPLGLAIVGPIASAVGVKPTLLGAFVLTMIGSVSLLLIPEMWRITAGSPTQPQVVPEESGVEVEAVR
jgi:hypothetical protein